MPTGALRVVCCAFLACRAGSELVMQGSDAVLERRTRRQDRAQNLAPRNRVGIGICSREGGEYEAHTLLLPLSARCFSFCVPFIFLSHKRACTCLGCVPVCGLQGVGGWWTACSWGALERPKHKCFLHCSSVCFSVWRPPPNLPQIPPSHPCLPF